MTIADHRALQESIADYLQARLDDESHRRLEEHLVDCEQCRSMVAYCEELMDGLREPGQTGAHPDPLALRRHARQPGAADPIAEHVRGCASCRIEVEMWRRRTERETPAPAPRRARGPWTGVGAWLAPRPMALGALVGASLVLFGWMLLDERRAPVVPGDDAPRWLLLEEPVRGAQTPRVEVSLPDDQLVLPIAVVVGTADELGPEGSYRFEVRNRAGEATWERTLPARRVVDDMQRNHMLLFDLPAAAHPPGAYRFRVLAQDAGASRLLMEIPFAISPGPG